MVGIAEGFALLFLGLVAGIISSVCDVVLIGSASFVSHFALWALLNAFVAIHVHSRLKAIWWAVPFNIGYMESYYLCTAASFEGYPKSLIVPLLGMALVSPLYTYAVWMAKRNRGFYGKFLSLLIAAGVFGASYYLFDTYDSYSIAISVVLLVVLLFWPARRLKFVPAPHPPAHLSPEPSKSKERSSTGSPRHAAKNTKKKRRWFARAKDKQSDSRASQKSEDMDFDLAVDSPAYDVGRDVSSQDTPRTRSARTAATRGGTRRSTERRTQRPTKRVRSTEQRERNSRRTRESQREQAVRRRDQRSRAERRNRSNQTRSRSNRSNRSNRSSSRYEVNEIAPLGTARMARPSSRRGRSRS